MKVRLFAFLGAIVCASCSGRHTAAAAAATEAPAATEVPATAPAATEALDYDQMIPLDAEDLSEQGFARGYEAVLPKLLQYVSTPAAVEEIDRPETEYYAVRSQGVEYVIYVPDDSDTDPTRGRATFALFDIVNRQLRNAPRKFYAINRGNDLGGMFLTEAELRSARRALPNRRDWPYLPTNVEPNFGAPN